MKVVSGSSALLQVNGGEQSSCWRMVDIAEKRGNGK